MTVPRFVPNMRPATSLRDAAGENDPLVFASLGQDLLVLESAAGVAVPRRSFVEKAGLAFDSSMLLGSFDGQTCLAGTLSASSRDAIVASGLGLTLRSLRSLFGAFDEAMFAAAGLGMQLAHFDDYSRHCGRCAATLVWKLEERGKRCPNCDRDVYPHIAPCAIVLVTNPQDDTVLLTRQARFPKGMYGLVAGFLEAGESIEECAAREVMEETGIVVGDIQYFGSQPWPFPSQLMVGFTAKYVSGTMAPDGKELEDAQWFKRNAMPGLPPFVSIARRLIDSWLAGTTS